MPVRSSEGRRVKGGRGQKSALSQAEDLILQLAVGPAAVYASGFYFWFFSFRTWGEFSLGFRAQSFKGFVALRVQIQQPYKQLVVGKP